MYATLLAQPVRWVRSIVARCAFRRTAPDGSQQRRVMPPFGGCPDGLVPIPFSAGGGAPQRPMRIDHAPLVRNGRICMITNLAPAAEHRMYATLLAQPQPGRDLSSPVCAISRTTSNACQQRRVMPPFGGFISAFRFVSCVMCGIERAVLY
jgi:hypothetical protein